jgi:hypothetical protein
MSGPADSLVPGLQVYMRPLVILPSCVRTADVPRKRVYKYCD